MINVKTRMVPVFRALNPLIAGGAIPIHEAGAARISYIATDEEHTWLRGVGVSYDEAVINLIGKIELHKTKETHMRTINDLNGLIKAARSNEDAYIVGASQIKDNLNKQVRIIKDKLNKQASIRSVYEKMHAAVLRHGEEMYALEARLAELIGDEEDA